MTEAKTVDAFILQFQLNALSNNDLAFLDAHRCTTKQLQIADQENKMAFVVAEAETRALVYDEVEEEFGVAELRHEAAKVYRVELVGSFSQALQEFRRRVEN